MDRGGIHVTSPAGVATVPYGFQKPVKKKPRLGTTGLMSKATSIVERVANIIIAGKPHAHSVLEIQTIIFRRCVFLA
jgi:hypothetical protein